MGAALSASRLFLFATAFVAGVVVNGQCTGSLSLGPDITVCDGTPVTLTATSGFLSYLWSTGATTSSITVNGAGTYDCTVTEFNAATNAVSNGDFSAGATGFTSDYVPGTGGPWGPVSLAGTYATSTSPNLVHTNFASFGDHTTGSGQMLVVNGAQVAGQNIWCQTVNVLPNTLYAFSAWLASATSSSPAQLQYTVNGVPIGNLNATSQLGVWLNFYSTWNSGAATTATLCITNLNTQQSGNDFAMDDITFSQFCTYTDAVNVIYNPYPAPDLGPDPSYCADSSIVLDPQWPGADSYAWQDGSTGATYVPQGGGVVWVDVTEAGCTTRDSVVVTVRPLPVADIGPDQQSCDGQVVVLDASYPGATYTWHNGSTAPTFNATTTVTASVTVDLAGCLDQDTALVQFYPLPVVDLGADTTICPADALVLNAFEPGAAYVWQDGSTGPQQVAAAVGTYWVVVSEDGCQSTDSLVLTKFEPPFVDLGPDHLLCAGNTEVLQAEGPGLTYLWSDGSTDAELPIDGPGLYWVIVSDQCSADQDSISITWDYCDCPVYVPNTFTADGDGINERFLPRFACPNRTYMLRIFDRWGREQWGTSDPDAAWDGGGLPIGVYAWTLEYVPDSDVAKGKRKAQGHVLLLR